MKGTTEERAKILSLCKSFPYLSNVKIAKLLTRDYGTKYTQGTLRQIVSYVKQEKNLPTTELVEPFSSPVKEIQCPESLYEDYTFHQIHIPPVNRSVLVISDIHIPFHDKKSIEDMVGYCRDMGNIDSIIINGDLLDFYGLSRFNKLHHLRSVKTEIDIAKLFLEYLMSNFPHSRIFLKFGNHEERLEWHFNSEANRDISDLDEIKLEYLLDKEAKVTFIKDKQIIKIGKLYIIHGHEAMGGSGAINIARGVRLKTNENIVFGHFHKSQDDYQTTIGKSIIGSWAIGCLCGLNPLYLPINNWNHGFGILNFNPDGTFQVLNKKIINNKVL